MIKTALNGIEEVNPPGKKKLQQKVSVQRILFLLVSTILKKEKTTILFGALAWFFDFYQIRPLSGHQDDTK